MSVDISKILFDQIRDAQVVLFLGAGATVGANHPKNIKPPVGKELASLLSKKFLGDEYKGRSLDQIAELAISETNLHTVQSYIASIFTEFTPADFHLSITTFKWASLVTTNFDLIIEKAYEAANKSIQRLVVFKKNGEHIEEKLKSTDNIIYLKLHGCITDLTDNEVPLILTPEQYITHRKGRSRLFERLHSLACEYPILFVGHSLADIDVRAILNEVSQLADAKPRSYILTPNIAPAEKRFWESKKFTCINASFKDFMQQLDVEFPSHLRTITRLKVRPDHPIHSRFITSENTKPSESLTTVLTKDVEYLHKGYKADSIDPNAFYKGYYNDFAPIVHNLDIRRTIADNILSAVFLTTEASKRQKAEFILIKGHAGSGKSVLLRRIAWDASIEYDKLCLFVKPNSQLNYEPLYELYHLTNERLFIFIDPASEYQNLIEDLLDKASKDKLPLTILAAERHNEWNSQCEDLESYVTDNYEVKYLVPEEIEALLELLTKHNSLGYLKSLTREQQRDALAQKAGRQLLVALHEATFGKPFSDIIFDEYSSITSPEARSLYLSVCILHRLGVFTRAGMISRVHGIPFNLFREKLFKPLEFIVFTSYDDLIKDYYYRTRHAHIAEIVFERVLIDPQERYDEYVRIIGNLDTDYKSDREAFKGLMNAKHLMQLFGDTRMIRQLYAIARTRVQDDPKLMQQEAIFEMSNDAGDINRAQELLETANHSVPYDKAILHSLSVLASNKARRATTDLEKQKLRNESKNLAKQLISKRTISSHPYHTIIKVELEELAEFMQTLTDQSVIERKVKEIEKVISEATQAFPNSTFILDAEARFSSLIEKHPRVIEALEKAFSVNKRSPYIASRLAKTYESCNRIDDAIKALKECLDANPNDKLINYSLAMLLMKTENSNVAEIRHYLRRSFTEGDSNYVSQFWYARLLYLENERSEALELFHKLNDAKIDIRTKKEPRGLVRENGKPKRFAGVVTQIESTYAFLTRDGENDSLFTYFSYNEESVWSQLSSYGRITFEMEFNYRGPIALRIKPESYN